MKTLTDRLRIATASLCGCFGCHMSLLDIDERLINLADIIEFDRCPFNDNKELHHCDIGIIEGGVANEENVNVLRSFRKQCDTLIAFGACAVNGGIPAMRNLHSLQDCLETSYINGIGVCNPGIPDDPEIPMLLNKVHPVHEVVKIDYFLPGCPPSADTIWTFLNELVERKPISFPYTQIHYD
jgi:NAD-reducing hydrogenase small subunit